MAEGRKRRAAGRTNEFEEQELDAKSARSGREDPRKGSAGFTVEVGVES